MTRKGIVKLPHLISPNAQFSQSFSLRYHPIVRLPLQLGVVPRTLQSKHSCFTSSPILYWWLVQKIKTVFLLNVCPRQGTHSRTLYRLSFPVVKATVAGTKPLILYNIVAHLTPQMRATGPYSFHSIVSLPQPKTSLVQSLPISAQGHLTTGDTGHSKLVFFTSQIVTDRVNTTHP